MIKKILFALALCGIIAPFGFTSSAQSPCKTDQVNAQLMLDNPEFKKLRARAEQQYFDAVTSGEISRSRKAGLVTIPIVFHVIHDGDAYGTGSNISDEQIQSAVDGMNIQYRNLNPDGSTFDPDGIDLEFEFCLAKRDPNGNPTNGINRVDGTIGVPNYESTGITSPGNERDVKALSRWDYQTYYNVWVVNRIDGADPYQGGTKGYAYFPGAGGDVDGTVVLFNSTGYDPDGSLGFDLFGAGDNGTMVHEIGHAFALNHTWNGNGRGSNGGCGNGGAETPCLTTGDLVCDTDPHESHLGSCKSSTDSNPCNGGQPFGDFNEVRNYMNYTNCSNLIFTPGQRDRVRNALENDRSYWDKPGQTPDVCVPVFQFDAAVDNLIAPKGFFCDANVEGKIVLKNNGQDNITSVDIEYGVDGNVLNTFTWTGNLPQLEGETVDLPAVTVTVGAHTFFAQIKQNSINGTNADEYMSNDYKSSNFEVIAGNTLKLTVNNAAESDVFKVLDENGVTVTEFDFKGTSNPYVEDLCLPDGCFTVVFTDKSFTHPLCGGPDEPSYTLETDNGFAVASGIELPLICSGSHDDTSEEFCLPFDPGFITADFTADLLLIEAGDAVKFTDKSKNKANESPTTWKWKFGDGGTSTQQHPNYVYNTPGVYSVELAADNNIFPDTLVKTHYIRVVAKTTGCDNYNNLISAESESGTSVATINSQPNKFPACGPDVQEFAERFYTKTLSGVRSVDFNVLEFAPGSSNPMLEVSIYEDNGGLPGTALITKGISLADLVVGVNTMDFSDDNITVQGRYYIGFKTPNINDLVVVGMAAYRIPTNGSEDFSNTVFIRSNASTWATLTDEFDDAEPTSLDITVNLSFKPKALISSVDNSTCLGITVNFGGSNSENAESYEWYNGGSPANGSAVDFSTSFASPGTKEVTLVVTGGCAESDTAIFFVEVTGKPTIDIETIDDVCATGTGIAKAVATGGSGTVSYVWKVSPDQYGDEANNLVPGTYNLEYTDIGCNVKDEVVSFTIGNVTMQPDYEIETADTECGLNNGNATAKPTGGTGNFIYEWSSPDHTDFSSNSSGVTGLAPGSYTVSVGMNGCNPRVKTIVIGTSEPASGTVDDPVYVCQNDQVTLMASSNDSITWTDDDGNQYVGSIIVLDSISKSTSLNVTFTDRGTKCEAFATTAVFMQPQPIAIARATKSLSDFYSRDTTYVDDPVNEGFAYFSSAGSNGTSYFWDFDDTRTSTSKNPNHQFFEAGTFIVKIRVANEPCGSMDSTVVIVTAPGDSTTSTVGISGNELETLKIYPNPTSSILNIDGVPSDYKVILRDLTGKELISNFTNGQMYVGDKAKGVYMLEIVGTENKAVLRFVVE
jgi:PKD repeat protein